MTKLLCTGDLHIGAGSEYGRAPGDRLADQEAVWTRILELAVDENVDGVLFAGDAFEGPTPTSEHYQAFVRPIQEVLQDRIPVLAVSGNGRHDSAMRSTNALQIFDGLGVTVSSFPDVYRFAGCAVATLPWVSPARLIAARGGGDRDEINAEVAQLLVDIAARGREDCARVTPDGPAILLGHWSISGSSLPTGLPVDQLREPVIPMPDLEALGFDAIVLGHIHKSQGLGTSHDRHLLFDEEQQKTYGHASQFYVGSPMPLNHGEAANAHGVWIIDLPGGSSSSVPATATPADGQSIGPHQAGDPRSTRGSRSTFHPIASRPFVTLDIDITGDEETSGLAYVDLGHAANGHDLTDAIVRFRYRATADQARRIDMPLLRRELIDAGAAVVKVQPDIVRADRARVEDVTRPDEISEHDWLHRWLDLNGVDADLRDEALGTFDCIQAGA